MVFRLTAQNAGGLKDLFKQEQGICIINQFFQKQRYLEKSGENHILKNMSRIFKKEQDEFFDEICMAFIGVAGCIIIILMIIFKTF